MVVINGKGYKAQIRNVNFDSKFKRKNDVFQIRYSRNGELSKVLQSMFFKSYKYIEFQREMRSAGERTMIKLPELDNLLKPDELVGDNIENLQSALDGFNELMETRKE